MVYGDLRPDGALRLDILANYLQTAAISHAVQAQQGMSELTAARTSWVLYRLSAVVLAPPRGNDRLVITTWATGFRGVRGSREFAIHGDGRLIARAASTWVLIDTVRAAPRRIPPEVAARFAMEPAGEGFTGTAHARELQPVAPAAANGAAHVSLRASDFDDNGHVNNAAYLDFALTALAQHQPDRPAPRGFVVGFLREIRREVTDVAVALAPSDNEIAFSVSAAGSERARGVLTF